MIKQEKNIQHEKCKEHTIVVQFLLMLFKKINITYFSKGRSCQDPAEFVRIFHQLGLPSHLIAIGREYYASYPRGIPGRLFRGCLQA